MKKLTMISATSAIALFAAMPLAFAQAPDTKEPATKGSSASQAAPKSRGSGPSAQSERRGNSDAGQAKSSEEKAGGKARSSAEQSDGARSRGKQAGSDTKSRSTDTGKQAGDDHRRSSKSDDGKARADRGERNRTTAKDNQRTEREGRADVRTRDDKSGSKSAADSDLTAKEKSRQADRDATAKDKASRQAGTKEGTAGNRTTAQLTVEQRDTFRQRLVQTNPPRVTNVNVNIRIGERLPRRVQLRALPVVLVDEFPQYRNYRYVLIRDEICIVDPATYEIVEVIGTSSRGSGSQVALSLSNADRRFVYREISRMFDPISIDMRLAIGADLPGSVEVHAFPDIVVQRIPELRRYRFVRTSDRVLVIEPNQHEVVLLIGD